MTTRIILAGILGAIAMFLWTFVAHMFLPLGDAGIEEIPNEQAVTGAMQSSIGDKTGFYFFPGPGLGHKPTKAEEREAMKQVEKKMKTNPHGIVIYHPAGQLFNFPRSLIIEFITELIEALLVVSLLAQTRIATFGGRVVFVLVAGILAAVATNISYWNWYGFPTVYTVSYMTIQIVGFFCIGIVAGLVFRNQHGAV